MIYFVRHGSTDWNENLNSNGDRDPKCQGRIDIPLNEKGIQQAKETAKLLSTIKFSKVICSPLIRARQTLDLIYNGGGGQAVQIDERVIERDFGEFEGLTRTEFDFKGFWNANCKLKYKKAESIEDVKRRVFSLLDELKKRPKEDVLIVSHGGVGLVLLSYFKGVPADGDYLKFEIPNGKPLILNFDEKE